MSSISVYQNRLKAVRTSTARAVAAQWAQLDNFDRPQAAPFAARVAPIVAAGQMTAAKITVAQVSRLARVTPIRLDQAGIIGARQGVDPTETYQRPFGAVWAALAAGVAFDRAVQQGADRLDVLAVTDVWLASRAATEQIDAANPRITGWVRVADGGACELCSAADGMPLDQAADMAGHPSCGCTSSPTFDGTPDSAPADPAVFDVNHHDELGAVLTTAGDNFAAA